MSARIRPLGILAALGLLTVLALAGGAPPAQAKSCHLPKSSAFDYVRTTHVSCTNGRRLAKAWRHKKGCAPIHPGDPGYPFPDGPNDPVGDIYFPTCHVKHFRCTSKAGSDDVTYQGKCTRGHKRVRFRLTEF